MLKRTKTRTIVRPLARDTKLLPVELGDVTGGALRTQLPKPPPITIGTGMSMTFPDDPDGVVTVDDQ